MHPWSVHCECTAKRKRRQILNFFTFGIRLLTNWEVLFPSCSGRQANPSGQTSFCAHGRNTHWHCREVVLHVLPTDSLIRTLQSPCSHPYHMSGKKNSFTILHFFYRCAQQRKTYVVFKKYFWSC